MEAGSSVRFSFVHPMCYMTNILNPTAKVKLHTTPHPSAPRIGSVIMARSLLNSARRRKWSASGDVADAAHVLLDSLTVRCPILDKVLTLSGGAAIDKITFLCYVA